jgi:hypothetical protein
VVPAQPARLLYVSHVEGRGVDLFRAVSEQDLEGIVAKLKTAAYGTEPPSWVKIKNPDYSQAKDRRERFEKPSRICARCATVPEYQQGAVLHRVPGGSETYWK